MVKATLRKTAQFGLFKSNWKMINKSNNKDLNIVFTGSSIIDISRQNIDLSRRAVQYELTGLSYREFLSFKGIVNLEAIPFKDLLNNHIEISTQCLSYSNFTCSFCD